MMDTQQKDQNAGMNDHASEKLSVGKTLRAAREQMGLSVNDVANRIKFAPRQIEALEDDDYERLPEAAFVRGFVRSYARLLELDTARMLASLPSSHANTSSAHEVRSVEIPMPTELSARRYNIIWLAAALVIALSMAIFERMHDSTPEEAEPVTKDTVQVIDLPNVNAENASEQVQQHASVPQVAARPVTPISPRQITTQTPARAAPGITSQQPVPHSAVLGAPAMASRQLVPPSPVRNVPTTPVAAAAPAPAAAPIPATPAVVAVPAPPQPVRPAPVQLPLQAVPQLENRVGSISDGQPVMGSTTNETPHSLRMEFDEDAWVELKEGTDKILISRMHRAGSLVRVTGKGPMLLTIGNSQAVRVFDNEKQLKPGRPNSSGVARITLN